jgi:hypothetical protein
MNVRAAVAVAWMVFGACVPAAAEVSIGVNLQVYPDLVPVPGYPVYYAPQADANFFFYDGLYWVYADDQWYSSSWYNGPWDSVPPEWVPVFVLRVPVRYYRSPPPYFRDWGPEAPPRWGEHWGRDWEQRRNGWDRWDHASAPAPAPLPTYQREYSGNRYPRPDQQQVLRNQNYHYQPHEAVVRQQFEKRPEQPAPARRIAESEHDSRSAPPPGTGHVPSAAAPSAAERGDVTERPPAAGRHDSRPPPSGQAADRTPRPQPEGGGRPHQNGPGGAESRQDARPETGPEKGSPPREAPPPQHPRDHSDKRPENATPQESTPGRDR